MAALAYDGSNKVGKPGTEEKRIIMGVSKSRNLPHWGQRGTAAATIAARLVFENISRQFGTLKVVDNLSLDMSPGEIVCLLGPSGCGKTTTLRIAAGIERPSGGRILLNGQEISGPDYFVLPEKRNMGLMFQDFALFPHLTILDNVAFGLNNLHRSEALREAGAVLERVGLSHYSSDYPHILSGGEQQRVALARAITPRPSVLLMDEPFSGLDNRLREAMREETLTVLKETRATCMIVTHQPEEAIRMGDRIAVMREGKLIQLGLSEELYRNPADLFIAHMFSDINEIICPVKNGVLESPLGSFPATNGTSMGGRASIGSEAILCIRQRAVRLVASGKGRIGRVLDVKFLGDAALLEIAIEGLETRLLARIDENEAPEEGQEVCIEIDPSLVLIFTT